MALQVSRRHRKNMDLEFVDQKGSGDYRLTVPLAEKDFLALAPPYNWHDWKDYEPARFTLTSGSELTVWDVPVSGPRVRFKDLEAMVVAHIIRAQLYFSHRVEYVRASHASTMAHIVIDIPDNNSSSSDGQVPKAFEIFGRISNLSGRVVDTFERNGSLAERKSGDQPDPDREEIFPLAPGSYRLAIVVKNALSGETGVVYAPLDVPTYEELAIRK